MSISRRTTRCALLVLVTVAAWSCSSDPTGPALEPTGPAISAQVVAGPAGVSDGQGKVWRQLIETTGSSWTQVAQVCPRDGAAVCSGVAAGRDLTGWVWATADQVRALLALFEPGILTSPSVSGPQYFFTADVFFGAFRPTFSFSGYTGSSTLAAGWTSSTDPSGAPIAGSVGNGHNMVSIGGSFSIVPVANPNDVTADRGVFLWRADGSGGGTVIAAVVDAVNDAGSAPSAIGGTAVANVLANDRLDGAQATTGNVVLSFVSATTSGLALDLTDGSVDVAAGTAGGAHALVYRICESASPSNCDQATVAVTVAPQALVLSKTSLTVNEGNLGQFTVRLSQRPATSVVVSLAYLEGTAVVAPSPATLTFTPANWNVAKPVKFQAPHDSDKYNNAATIQISSPGIAAARVVATIIDDDRPLGDPLAITTAPLNAQTVSGTIYPAGTGTDSNGQVVEARFSVDGNRIFRVQGVATTFRMNGGWNTRTVANGWHTLELRIFDNSGVDGRMLIKVFVSN